MTARRNPFDGSLLFQMSTLTPVILFVGGLKWIALPKDSRVPKHAAFHTLVLVAGVLFLQLLKKVPSNDEKGRVFTVVVAFPIFR